MNKRCILLVIFIVAIGKAQVIKGYDYCHDNHTEKVNIVDLKTYKMLLDICYNYPEDEECKRELEKYYDKLKGTFSIKVEFEKKNNIDISLFKKNAGAIMTIVFGGGNSSFGNEPLKTVKIYDRKGRLIEKTFYVSDCEVGPTRTFNRKGKLIETKYYDDYYFVGIEQVRNIILNALGVDIFEPYQGRFVRCFFSRMKIEGKYVYSLEFISRGEEGSARKYYIDAYDGKFLFKDIRYSTKKEYYDSFEFPKERIFIPIRDSINIDK